MSNPGAMPDDVPVADMDALPFEAALPVAAPRVWVFVESADESCDMELVGGYGAGALRRGRPAEGGGPGCPLWRGWVGRYVSG